MNLRVFSLNTHKLVSPLKRRYFLAELKNYLEDVNADIVFLQEFRGRHPLKETGRFTKDDPLEHMADTLWPHFAYGQNAIYPRGSHGNAILSRYPFLWWENVDVSNHKLERRGILHGIVEPPIEGGHPIHLLCVHFDLSEWGRRQQTGALCEMIFSKIPQDEAVIIAGDFNDWRLRSAGQLKESGLREAHYEVHRRHARSFPAVFPVLSLDRIYYRNLECMTSSVLQDDRWKNLSDHLPLLAEFELEPKR